MWHGAALLLCVAWSTGAGMRGVVPAVVVGCRSEGKGRFVRRSVLASFASGCGSEGEHQALWCGVLHVAERGLRCAAEEVQEKVGHWAQGSFCSLSAGACWRGVAGNGVTICCTHATPPGDLYGARAPDENIGLDGRVFHPPPSVSPGCFVVTARVTAGRVHTCCKRRWACTAAQLHICVLCLVEGDVTQVIDMHRPGPCAW